MKSVFDRRPSIPGHLLAILFSLFSVLGQRDLSSNSTLVFGFLGYYMLYLLLWWFLQPLFSISLKESVAGSWSAKKVFVTSMIVFLLCWLPYFLAYYPGILSSDSIDQLRQVVGDLQYSNHHPWLHTLFIGLIYRIGISLFRNSNHAVALYTVIQMLIMAATYAYMIMTLYQKQVRRWLIVLILAFYALVPFHALYAITMWKDVLFSAVCLLLGILLWKLLTETVTLQKLIACVILGILFCLLRSNGFYAYLLCIPFFLFGFKKIRKQMFIVIASTLCVVFLFKGPIMSAYNVSEPDLVESLSIPLQQIAGTIHEQGVSCLTPEEHLYLGIVIDLNQVENRYASIISDPIKNLIRESGNQQYLAEHFGDFLKIYLGLGIRYPKEYLLSYIKQTYGYWYPDVEYLAISTEIFKNSLDLSRTPLLSGGVLQFMETHVTNYTEPDSYNALWKIGTYIWFMLSTTAITAHKRHWQSLLIFLPFIGLWGSLLVATPVFAEFRYAYSIVVAIPLFFALAGLPVSKEE